jgi:hypothetical protein
MPATPNKSIPDPEPTPPGTVIDPTKNVLDLVRAAIGRQDDLREANLQLFKALLDALEKLTTLRSTYIEKLNKAETRRINEVVQLRSDYTEKLSRAESNRIDAIRAVDVNATAVGSARQADQASVLANQVAQSAETQRGLVATTAATIAAQFQQVTSSLTTRLTTLEQASYQAQGKQSYADPAFLELLTEVKRLRDSSAGASGQSQGFSMAWGVVVVVATLILAGAGVFIASERSSMVPMPQVIYVPAPAPPTVIK